MYRRRAFRRRAVFSPRGRAHQALVQANHLKDDENYEEAAEIFERLAKAAQDRGILKHAPFLYLQAAHCYLLASKTDRGVGLVSHGLRLLEKTQRWPALHKAGERSVEELKKLGHTEVAEKIQKWLDETLKDHPEASSPEYSYPYSAQKRIPNLPAKCPNCGATLRSDQAEWIDETTAECLYCGSAIKAEG